MTQMVWKTGLIGKGISHSMSPQLHSCAYKAAGILDGYFSYSLLDLAGSHEGETLTDVASGLASQGFNGVNVTMPYKVSIVSLCDELASEAKGAGAVNTIVVERSSGSPRLIGHNTDASGFRAALQEASISVKDAAVALLGTGGVAHALVHILLESGVSSIRAYDVKLDAAYALAKSFGDDRIIVVESTVDAVSGVDGIANASPVGMVGFALAQHDQAVHDAVRTGTCSWVADAVYSPSVTPLVSDAMKAKKRVATGDRLLLHQLASAFSLMNVGLHTSMSVLEAEWNRIQSAKTDKPVAEEATSRCSKRLKSS